MGQNHIVLGETIPAATPADQKVSDAIHAYWVNFAKTGKPGAAGGPEWPASGKTDAALEFGSDGPVVREQFRKDQLDIIEAARKDK